jgi:membrane protease YdiL (CAAX protease family)
VWFFLMLGWILVTGSVAAAVARAPDEARDSAKWLVQILGLVLSVFFILYQRQGRRFFGLTLEGWAPSLRRGLLVTLLVFVPTILATRLVLDHLGLGPPGAPVFRLVPPEPQFVFYALLIVPLQEIGHRGVIQTYVRELCGGGLGGAAAAVVFASVVFAFGHLLFSPLFAFITFLCGIAWGIEFEKDRTLVGVIVSHALAGWLSLSCFSLSAPFGAAP